MIWPILYKKTSSGADQQWTIWTESNKIITEWGQLEGATQRTEDVVSEGKNIGKANETTPEQQAQAEAQSQFESKLKKGYVLSLGDAREGKVDAIIEGGISPMLAHTFEKQGHKIKYPCFGQPKLDGTRCICIVKSGKATLWSRTRKPITSMPHIIAEVEANFKDEDIVLDGEIYSGLFSENFEHITHLVRQETPDANCTDLQFHVYDLVNKDPFIKRLHKITQIFKNDVTYTYLRMVNTVAINNEDDVSESFTEFMNQGYEGLILRNSSGLYVNKRSYDLIKVKEMQDSEFPIVGIQEGRGKLSGHVGAFVCKTEDGQEFNCKMAGDTDRLKECFENESLWKGKLLTVKFQNLTSYGIPRFPIGKSIRDYE